MFPYLFTLPERMHVVFSVIQQMLFTLTISVFQK